MSAEIKLRVTDMAGVEVAELPTARLGRVKWELNKPEEFDFELDPHDPTAALVPLRPGEEVEVQLWVDGVLRGWGPVTRRDLRRTQVTGLLWHFSHRFLGPVYTLAPFYDGSFEGTAVGDIPTGWFDSAVLAPQPAERGVVANAGVEGNQALTISKFGADSDVYVAFTTPATVTVPYTLEVSGWYKIDGGGVGSFENRGLYVLVFDTATSELLFTVNGATRIGPEDTPNEWRRTVAKMVLPVGSLLVEVRLHTAQMDPVTGLIYWDLIDPRTEQRTWAGEDEDASGLIRRLVEYATGVGHGGGPAGAAITGDVFLKSDLNIGWDAANSTSVGRIGGRSYDHSDNAAFWACLQEFVSRDLCDMEITFNGAGTTREFTLHTPRKGTARPTWGFTLDDGGPPYGGSVAVPECVGNIVDFDSIYDGAQYANKVRVQLSGCRAGSEMGIATGADPVLVEKVVAARFDQDVNASQGLATAELARSQAGVITSITVSDAAGWLAKGLTTGDTIYPRIRYGWLDVNEAARIVAMTFDVEADTLTLTLNAP